MDKEPPVESNPFLAPSALPYQLPPFDAIEVAHFRPAFEAGMAEQRAEVAAIAADPQPPTLENTLAAPERSGRLLARVSAVFFHLTATDATDELQQIEREVTPKLAAHRDAIFQDRRLYARVQALADDPEQSTDPESAWLLQRYHTDFLRAGDALPEPLQPRLRALHQVLLCTILAARALTS